jgi:hypothetical protein
MTPKLLVVSAPVSAPVSTRTLSPVLRSSLPAVQRAVWLAVLAVSGPLWAQAPKGGGDDDLRGPAIEAAQPKTSLVDRDFNGVLRLPEPSPEAAAFELLGIEGQLPADQAKDIRERFSAILGARQRLLDEFCADNIELLIKFGSSAEAGRKGEVLSLLWEAMRELKPLRDRGTLESEIIAILPAKQQSRFKMLLREYRDAVVADADAESKRRGEKPKGRIGVLAEAGLKQLGKDVEASVTRQLKNGEFAFKYLTQGLELTGEQELRIREAVTAYVERVGDQEIKAEQVKLYFAISKHLTADQRKLFTRHLLKGEKPSAMKAKASSKGKAQPDVRPADDDNM